MPQCLQHKLQTVAVRPDLPVVNRVDALEKDLYGLADTPAATQAVLQSEEYEKR
jgi:hypothetical protein